MSAVAVGLAARINAAHDAAHGATRTTIEHAVECGRLLLEARSSIAHGEWLPWIEMNLSFGARQVQKYVRLARHADELSNATSNSHVTIDGALTALSSSPTLRVMSSSASDEWYTPPHIFDLATAVLGEVDLDPSWHPDSPVQASTTYTQADDGLARPWHGHTWLNPPYGREIGHWVGKLVDEYEAGRVTEALVGCRP